MRPSRILLLSFALLLAGCNLPRPAERASALPPIEENRPTASLPPSPTATPTQRPAKSPAQSPTQSAPPSATPSVAAAPESLPSITGSPLPPLAAGQEIVITYIQMTDESHGWGIGQAPQAEEAHILHTADGGQSWTDVSPPAGEQTLTDPAGLFVDTQHALVIYPAGPGQPHVIWQTSDGGTTWQGADLPPSPDAEFFSPSFFAADKQNIWLLVTIGAGMQHAYSDLYFSADGGSQWEKIADPFSPGAADLMLLPHTGMAFRGKTGWVTKENGVMDGVAFIITADGGRTWTSAMPDIPAQSDTVMCSTYSPVLFNPARGAYLTTCWNYQTDEQQTFFARVNGNQTSYTALPSVVDQLIFFSPQQGLALGCRDWGAPDPLACDLLRTTDGGQSWQKFNTVYWDGQFSFVDENHGWAVARNGEDIALVATDNGGRSWRLLEPVVAEGQ